MSKTVRFSENPVLVRHMSDRSVERRQNSQTPIEKRVASNSFFMEEKQKYNTDEKTREKYENKRKYENTPINKRISDSVLKGNKEDANIRKDAILEEHRYSYWWLGGKKIRKIKKTIRKKKCGKKCGKKSKKNKYC